MTTLATQVIAKTTGEAGYVQLEEVQSQRSGCTATCGLGAGMNEPTSQGSQRDLMERMQTDLDESWSKSSVPTHEPWTSGIVDE